MCRKKKKNMFFWCCCCFCCYCWWWWCFRVVSINWTDIEREKKMWFTQVSVDKVWISTRKRITIKNSVDNVISINPFLRRCCRCRFSPFYYILSSVGFFLFFFLSTFLTYCCIELLRSLCFAIRIHTVCCVVFLFLCFYGNFAVVVKMLKCFEKCLLLTCDCSLVLCSILLCSLCSIFHSLRLCASTPSVCVCMCVCSCVYDCYFVVNIVYKMYLFCYFYHRLTLYQCICYNRLY